MATAQVSGRKRRSSSSYSISSDYSSGSKSDDGKRMKSAVVEMPSSKPLRKASTSSFKSPTPPPKRKKEELDPLLTRTGGAYIPPARLRMMQENITDKSSIAYQRISWEATKKSINGLINKVNVSNIANIVYELFQENLIRGKGLVARSVIQAQAASPMFSHVYAALVAIINTKLPRVGELIIKRLVVRFRKSYRRNDKTVCIATVKFIAHLVNQHVLYELVALELLTLLLEEPSDDSVEVAVGFLKDCGAMLKQVNSQALHAVFETFRSILHSGKLTSRVQYMIEVLFAIRKDNFKDHPSVLKELDLVHEDDQNTHFLSLTDDDFDTEDKLNVFQSDANYLENEQSYEAIREEILGEGVGSGASESEEDGSEESEESDEDEDDTNKLDISDQTGTTELVLRRQIYLTIMSSLDFEECAHKLLKTMKEGHEKEIAFMLVECCSQERSFMRFYGALGQRLCLLNQAWVAVFNEAFQQQYSTVHRLETNKLRNVSKFFGQLFYVDALPWTSLECIRLNEEDTNSSSRIFIKILFQQLAEFMGLPRLNDRLRDPMLAFSFEGILPRDDPKNTRFAINFFTSIGLGGLTDDLREHLKNVQKLIMAQKQTVSSSDSSSDDDSPEDDSSSESESEESTSSEEEEIRRKRKHKERHSDKKRRDRSEERRKRKDGNQEMKGRRKERDEERRNDRDEERRKERDDGRRKERDDGRRKERDEERKDKSADGKRERHARTADGGREKGDGSDRDEGRKDRDDGRRKERDDGRRKERDEERKEKTADGKKERHARTADGRRERGDGSDRDEGRKDRDADCPGKRHRRSRSRDGTERREASRSKRGRHRAEEEDGHGEGEVSCKERMRGEDRNSKQEKGERQRRRGRDRS